MMTSRNDRFLKGGFCGLMIAAAILCGAFAAQADYSDENIATTDDSVRRLEVGGKSVYVFTNAASALTVTAKRNLAMTDCLLVGGGGAGGGKTGGGGGAGGVTNAANLGASAFVAKNGTFTVTVGAGGTHNNNPQSKGGNGGTTSIVFGEFSASVAGGGGGGSWNNGGGVAGASGGGSEGVGFDDWDF